MKHLLLFTILIFSLNCIQAQIKSLGDFRWESRLLVIYVGDQNSFMLEIQLAEILEETGGFKERDIEVIVIKTQKVEIYNSSKTHHLKTNEILNDLNIDKKTSYQNLLIGKDGGIKIRSNSPISIEKLYNTIDAMPMRKREMRDGN